MSEVKKSNLANTEVVTKPRSDNDIKEYLLDIHFNTINLKYPKLIELHEKLFDKSPNNLHNSFNDILVTLRCFMKLKYNLDLIDDCIKFKKYSENKCIF